MLPTTGEAIQQAAWLEKFVNLMTSHKVFVILQKQPISKIKVGEKIVAYKFKLSALEPFYMSYINASEANFML